jgi:hypothetical protein
MGQGLKTAFAKIASDTLEIHWNGSLSRTRIPTAFQIQARLLPAVH